MRLKRPGNGRYSCCTGMTSSLPQRATWWIDAIGLSKSTPLPSKWKTFRTTTRKHCPFANDLPTATVRFQTGRRLSASRRSIHDPVGAFRTLHCGAQDRGVNTARQGDRNHTPGAAIRQGYSSLQRQIRWLSQQHRHVDELEQSALLAETLP
jgi:hypothetical protein